MPILETTFNERNAEISPDGRWIAYESDESGRSEIHVRPFPDVNRGKWQVSTGGGAHALWARDGRELFFRSPTGAVMHVAIDAAAPFSPGVPTKLFEGLYFRTATGIIGRSYDVSPDGQRFLMIKEDAQRSQTTDYLIAVENAFAELSAQSK